VFQHGIGQLSNEQIQLVNLVLYVVDNSCSGFYAYICSFLLNVLLALV